MNAFLQEFTQQLQNKRGQSGGYPGDFDYCVAQGTNGDIVLSLSEVQPQGNRSTKFWRRPDVWGLSILIDLGKELSKREGGPFHLGLDLHIAEPGPKEAPYFEALRRRVSYLRATNTDLSIRLLSGDAEVPLDNLDNVSSRPECEIIRTSYTPRDDKDTAGRLEKDLQAFLFGQGLFEASSENISEASSTLVRDNIRLALLGEDFRFGRKGKGGLTREFPTGVFCNKVARNTRILPTWFIDLLTLNQDGDLAIIELKFIDDGAAALEELTQLLDYALFFHYYRVQLSEILAENGINWEQEKSRICAYLVSNVYHNRINDVWHRYNNNQNAIRLKRVGMGYVIQGGIQ